MIRVSNRRLLHRREGFVAAIALVCLLIVTTLGATLLQASLREYRQGMRRERQVQAFWLAESAVERARSALAASDKYQGETWQITSEQLAGDDAATIEIQIESVPGDSDLRRVIVIATCGNDERRVIQRREIQVRLPKQGEQT